MTPLKVKRQAYCIRLKVGLIEEARALGVDTKQLLEQTLEQAILSLKGSKKTTHTK